MKIVLSSIIHTDKQEVNARIDFANEALERMARAQGWKYLDNSAIGVSCLRGGLHLNNIGEGRYTENLLKMIDECLSDQ